jgi:hypothetical protein
VSYGENYDTALDPTMLLQPIEKLGLMKENMNIIYH